MAGSTYIVTESSPRTTTFIRHGRGGAGNTVRAESPSHPRSAILTSPIVATARRFYSGIGGAGNARKAGERPPITLDEDFRRAAARDQARVCHTGIGGAGNVFRRKASDASSMSSERDSFETTKSALRE